MVINNGRAEFKCFPGSTIKQLNHYSIPTISEEKPDVVVLHVGINDLMSTRENKTAADEIDEEITKIGKRCIENEVQTVFISSLTFRCKVEWDESNELETKANKNGFIYINIL